MTVGIYQIVNKVTGESYIGQSVNIERRFREHKGSLNKGKGNPYLQNSWYAYGEENFIFEIITECSVEELNELEIHFIDEGDGLFNIKSGGEQNNRHAEETKKKISEALKGVFDGENNPFYGKHHSEETKRLLSEKLSGENHPSFGSTQPEEFRQHLSEVFKERFKNKENHPNFGKRLSDSSKEKMSKSLRGSNSPHAKLNEEKVLDIKRAYATGITTPKELAEKYEVSAGNIYNILNGKKWKHVKLPIEGGLN